MKKLSIADSAFLTFESENTPMHVASLQIFELPARSRDAFSHTLYNKMRKFSTASYPFNQRVVTAWTKLPVWELAADFDIDNHLFFHELPSPGTREQLYKLVSSLHEPVLDRGQPLWEYHIIGGLKNRRFAIYTRLHHAYADGVTMTRWMTRSFNNKASITTLKPVWTLGEGQRKTRPSGEFQLINAVKKMLDGPIKSFEIARGLTKIGSQLALEKFDLTHNAISLPFSAPETPLNDTLTPDRQFATASVPMERVLRIRKAARVSLNQVAISCIDEALHRYLSELGQPLEQPLVISMPVSLRGGDGVQKNMGNEVCMVLVELAEDTDDPYMRLRDIGMKLRYVRFQVDELPGQAMLGYTMITSLTELALQTVKLDKILSPNSNLVISNVPGPRETLYLGGAKLAEYYPVSTIPPNNQLNITLFSYDQGLHFGLVATKQLKDLSNLGSYIYAAFKNLENAVLDPLDERSDDK